MSTDFDLDRELEAMKTRSKIREQERDITFLSGMVVGLETAIKSLGITVDPEPVKEHYETVEEMLEVARRKSEENMRNMKPDPEKEALKQELMRVSEELSRAKNRIAREHDMEAH